MASVVGAGSAAAAPYDWRNLPSHTETYLEPDAEWPVVNPRGRPVDVVLAVECLWLKALLEPFVAACLAVLQPGTVMYMSSRERCQQGSETFVSPTEAVRALEEAGCTAVVLAEEDGALGSWQGELGNDGELQGGQPVGPVQLFRIERATHPSVPPAAVKGES